MNAPAPAYLRAGNECYLTVSDRRFLVEIRNVAEDSVWVSFPGENYPADGAGAELEFHEGDGLLRYHMRVAIGPRKPGDGIVLRRAEAATHLKHRRNWRVPVDFPATIMCAASKVRGRLRDLSAQGAMVLAAREVSTNQAVELVVGFPREEGPLTLVAEVVHCGPDEHPGRFRVGCRFGAHDVATRKYLTEFLYARIRRNFAEQLKELYPPSPSRPG